MYLFLCYLQIKSKSNFSNLVLNDTSPYNFALHIHFYENRISQMRQNLIFPVMLIMVISNSKVLCFYIEFCEAKHIIRHCLYGTYILEELIMLENYYLIIIGDSINFKIDGGTDVMVL